MQHPEKFWYTIINPVSGGGKGQKLWPEIALAMEGQGLAYHPELTHHPGHAGDLMLQALDNGYKKILLVGGDGTYSNAINALFQQDKLDPGSITLAMIPAGTGNDWQRAMHPKAQLTDILDWMKADNFLMEDVGWVTYKNGLESHKRYFFNLAGLGFDAYVAKKYLSDNKGLGILSYLTGLLRGLVNFKPPIAEVRFGDEVIRSPMFILAVGIGRYFGGGMMVTPQALPHDGLFDLTLVKDISKIGVIGQLPKLYKGTFSHPKISQHQAQEISISSDQELFLQLDGEIVGHAPASFGILPAKLKVIVSPDSPVLNGK